MKNLKKLVLLFVLISTFSCSDNSVEEISDKNEVASKSVEQKIFFLSDFGAFANDKNSVVSKLSHTATKEFIASMGFREDGLIVTAKYKIIERELNEKQVEEFWLLFGMDRLEYTDHKQYKCVGPHNCKVDVSYICLTGC